MTLTTDAPVAVRPTRRRRPLLAEQAPYVPAAVVPRPTTMRGGRPSPHSRGRSQLRRLQLMLHTHAADLGLCLLAVVCAVLVARCLTS